MSTRSISIVIPSLNEAHLLPATLDSCRDPHLREIILVDGGSTDGTLEAAAGTGTRVLTGPRGRASQMNLGAAAASGPILLFLHADTRLPAGFGDEVIRVLNVPDTAAGAFSLGIDAGGFLFRVIERAVRVRSRWFSLPYGDQALFLSRLQFERAGGFPQLPILEDVELVRRLRRSGRVRTTTAKVRTSARRWERTGLARLTAINQVVLVSYLLGVEPQRLASGYKRLSERSGGHRRKI